MHSATDAKLLFAKRWHSVILIESNICSAIWSKCQQLTLINTNAVDKLDRFQLNVRYIFPSNFNCGSAYLPLLFLNLLWKMPNIELGRIDYWVELTTGRIGWGFNLIQLLGLVSVDLKKYIVQAPSGLWYYWSRESALVFIPHLKKLNLFWNRVRVSDSSLPPAKFGETPSKSTMALHWIFLRPLTWQLQFSLHLCSYKDWHDLLLFCSMPTPEPVCLVHGNNRSLSHSGVTAGLFSNCSSQNALLWYVTWCVCSSLWFI